MEQSVARRKRAAHLMCGTPFWGVAAAIGCSYFAYLAYAHLRDGEVAWSHDWESSLTGGVWIILILGLVSETNCWRERMLFVLLLANFSMAFGMAFWKSAPMGVMRSAREISLALWLLSILASLRTLRTPGGRRGGSAPQKEN